MSPREHSHLVEVSATLIHETELAYLLDDGCGVRAWVPKSQCEQIDEKTFEMPERIAIDKEFV